MAKQSLSSPHHMPLSVLRDYLKPDGMATATFIMFVATVSAGACNYIYQILMGNTLGNDFSELTALLSILYIVSVPANSVQSILTRYVSKYKVQNKDEEISWLIRHTLVLMLLLGGGILAVMVVLSPLIREFLGLTSSIPIFIVGIGAMFALLVPVGSGPLQGLQRFPTLGFQAVGGAVTKLGLGLAFVVLGFGVGGAVGGAVTGLAVSIVLSFVPIRRYMAKRGRRVDIGEVWRYTFPATIAVLCFTIITQVDVIFASHYFAREQASAYAAASMLGKIILFLPGAISAVMFPRISDAHTRSEETTKILRKSILLTASLSGIMAAGYVLFPELTIQVLYGGKFLAGVVTLQLLGVSMALFSIANLFMIYGLATDGHAYTWILSLFTLLQVGLIILFHETPEQLATVILITGLLVTLISGIHLELREREKRDNLRMRRRMA
jgi:O-antigen/teichoic acid export membrane protein